MTKHQLTVAEEMAEDLAKELFAKESLIKDQQEMLKKLNHACPDCEYWKRRAGNFGISAFFLFLSLVATILIAWDK